MEITTEETAEGTTEETTEGKPDKDEMKVRL
jgi:hypothetical protein